MGTVTGDDLLKLPVRMHGIELGRPVDLVIDTASQRVLGAALLCGDRAHRFLPFGAGTVTNEEIAVDSALAVLDDAQFYLERGRTLRALRNAPVYRGGVEAGLLQDVLVAPDGTVVEAIVRTSAGTSRVAMAEDVAFVPPPAARSAA